MIMKYYYMLICTLKMKRGAGVAILNVGKDTEQPELSFSASGGYIFWKILWHCLLMLCLPGPRTPLTVHFIEESAQSTKTPGVQYQEEQYPSSKLATTQRPIKGVKK